MPFGFLNVDKPPGVTSRSITSRVHTAIAKQAGVAKRRLKVGHVGTLDPMATGVLVIAVGPATRLCDLLHEQGKRYIGSFRLGLTSDTEDIEGNVTPSAGELPTERMIRDAIPRFLGLIEQIPPSVSAKRINGKRAHELVRRGEAVALPAVPVTIESIELTDWNAPDFTLDITCGAGTYIRSLGRDLACACGSTAVMTSLRRLESGPFIASEAVSVDAVEAAPIDHLLSPKPIVERLLATVAVDAGAAAALRDGQPIANPCDAEGRIAVVSGEELVAIAQSNGSVLQPRIVFRR